MLRYHITVTSGLQCVARLARLSPIVAVLDVPVSKALKVAQRQLDRYPTIATTHGTRTALRAMGMPTVQLVVMPPSDGTVTMLLLSNREPPDTRERWQDAYGPDPLTWRNYELCVTAHGSVSWRLSKAARVHYRQRIARLITGRGLAVQGQRPYQLPDATASAQLQQLQIHLYRYPGLSGVRSDIASLQRYARTVWTTTRRSRYWTVWPHQPYARYRAPQTAPLDILQEMP